MTNKDRDRIRKLQDDLLETASVRHFIGQQGANVPLWAGGPTANSLHDLLYPAHEATMRQVLADAKR